MRLHYVKNGCKGFSFLWFLDPPPHHHHQFLNRNSFCEKSSAEMWGTPSRPFTENGVASTFPFLCPLYPRISKKPKEAKKPKKPKKPETFTVIFCHINGPLAPLTEKMVSFKTLS